MLFSSPIFLFLFLPLALLGYYLCFRSIKNYWLLLVSLIFFAWGGVSYTIILIGSVVMNYIFGLLIEKFIDTRAAYWWLTAGVTCNLLLLAVFKYANFFTANFNELFKSWKLGEVPLTDIVLPIGISFYTFHSLSYLVDIYRRKARAQKNIFDLALYICMFSQLIAGPIIRYNDIWLQLRNREHTLIKFASGVEQFIIGLGKKVLLANTFGRIADTMFASDPSTLGAMNVWLGMVSYTFQIYCDFAGYSDMAIGLGRMFGFEFLENFNFPYLAISVKDFWRRWHISLSSFFRDYVYIPLGGNRAGNVRVYVNLVIVFFLTGFWHGASWSFVVWGLFHGFFMIVERLGLEKLLERIWKPIAITYTFLVVMFGWVLFRADTLTYAMSYWKALLDFTTTTEQMVQFRGYMDTELIAAFVITLLGAFGFFRLVYRYIEKSIQGKTPVAGAVAYTYHTASLFVYAIILALCTMNLIAGTYNPFIYYKF